MENIYFNNIINFTIKHEGGYVNHPNDPGGETNFGISKRQYPNLDIKNISSTKAKLIYFNDYWLKPKANKLNELTSQVFFESCVNLGRRRATRHLQLAINIINKNKTLVVDGLIGPNTIKESNKLNDKDLARVFLLNKIDFYRVICNKRKKFRDFLLGWLNRSFDLREYLLLK